MGRKDRTSELKQVTEQELDNTFRQLMTAYFRIEGAYDGTRDQRAQLADLHQQPRQPIYQGSFAG
jgi:hypothetical protein